MVLDIRYPREWGSTTESAESGSQGSLEELLNRAMASQAPVVEQLRSLEPDRDGITWLWSIVADAGDERRLVAAQMLGCHRQWLDSDTRVQQVLDRAHNERDPAVRAALVWGLRNREEVGQFLSHQDGLTAREAALGLPLNSNTATALLTAIHQPPSQAVLRILQQRLHSTHVSLVEPLVEGALQFVWGDSEDRLEALFARLPQVRLFELAVERGRQIEWQPEQKPVKAGLSTRRRRLARVAGRALLREPTSEFLRYLLRRFVTDEDFARPYGNFVQEALGRVQGKTARALLDQIERLSAKASDGRLIQLAQLLVHLERQLEKGGQKHAQTLLESWQKRSPQLRLKIFHLKQGLD